MRALAIALLSGLWLAACGSSDPQPPRNLLLLSIDTLRADALGSHGSERGASPFLDRWAERGVRFASAWSQSPKTAPSHMTMLTGLAPRVHGVGNFETAGSASLGPHATTLAEVLSAEGFATGGFTDGGNARGSLGFNRGFEHFVSSKPKTWESRAQQVRAWLTERDGRQPWFLFLHTYAIHDPYFPPPEVAARFVDPDYEGAIIGDRAALEAAMEVEDLVPGMEGRMRLLGNYWGRVDMESAADMRYLHDLYLAGLADLDRKLERLFGWMEARGLLDDTLVVITSDHGEEFGEHGKLRHDQLWRELTHVPLLVRLPGDRHAGRVVEASVPHTDLFASLLELLDVDVSFATGGLADVGPSWAAWLERPEQATDRPIYGEHRSRRELALDTWTVRRDGWLLYGTPQSTRLFRMETDPLEAQAIEAPDRAALLDDWQKRELGRLQGQSVRYSTGAGTELTAEIRAELEALGYLEGPSGDR